MFSPFNPNTLYQLSINTTASSGWRLIEKGCRVAQPYDPNSFYNPVIMTLDNPNNRNNPNEYIVC